MDIFSHGLYGGVAFGRTSKKSYWMSVVFGVLPDLITFGVVVLGFIISVVFGDGSMVPPEGANGVRAMPAYVHVLYNLTHSLVIFACAFLFVWAIRGRVLWEMCAWALHVFIDIFTHSTEFFPTPFLWPISDYRFDGRNWTDPAIFMPNLLFLASLYGVWFFKKRRNHT